MDTDQDRAAFEAWYLREPTGDELRIFDETGWDTPKCHAYIGWRAASQQTPPQSERDAARFDWLERHWALVFDGVRKDLPANGVPAYASLRETVDNLAILTYPRWIASEKMSQQKADHEIAAMQAVLETLLGVQEKGRLL